MTSIEELKKAAEIADLALTGFGLIASVIGGPGLPGAILLTVKGIVDAVSGAADGSMTIRDCQDALDSLANRLHYNDQTADAKLRQRFPHEGGE